MPDDESGFGHSSLLFDALHNPAFTKTTSMDFEKAKQTKLNIVGTLKPRCATLPSVANTGSGSTATGCALGRDRLSFGIGARECQCLLPHTQKSMSQCLLVPHTQSKCSHTCRHMSDLRSPVGSAESCFVGHLRSECFVGHLRSVISRMHRHSLDIIIQESDLKVWPDVGRGCGLSLLQRSLFRCL